MCRVSIPGRGWRRPLPEHPAAIPCPWLCSLAAEWGRVCVPGCPGPVAVVLSTHVRGSLTSPCPAAARQCHLQLGSAARDTAQPSPGDNASSGVPAGPCHCCLTDNPVLCPFVHLAEGFSSCAVAPVAVPAADEGGGDI